MQQQTSIENTNDLTKKPYSFCLFSFTLENVVCFS